MSTQLSLERSRKQVVRINLDRYESDTHKRVLTKEDRPRWKTRLSDNFLINPLVSDHILTSGLCVRKRENRENNRRESDGSK